MMTYDEFKEYTADHLAEYIAADRSADAQVDINCVYKNNGIVRDGVTIRYPDQNIAPTIYLDDIYADYQEGMSEQACMHKIVVETDQAYEKVPHVNVGELFDYATAKEHLYVAAVNYESNKEMLKEMPYERHGDIALVARVDVPGLGSNGYSASYKVTNVILDKYGVSQEQLLSDALQNSARIRPVQFINMEKMLRDMVPGIESLPDLGMHVLTNVQKTDGAAVMFYPGVMNEVEKQMGRKVTIIPSSTHEVIVIPADASQSEKEFAEMIAEVNKTEVAVQEILGYRPLVYDEITKEVVPMAEQEQYLKDIKDDIVRSGHKPTDTLMRGMRQLDNETGFRNTMSDVHRYSKMEAADFKNDPSMKQTVDEIVAECRAQEIARFQAPEL